MSKNKAQTIESDPSADTVVSVVDVSPHLTIVNPYVEVRVDIHGLPVKSFFGVRDSVMKTVRSWIRARNLSVQMHGVIKEKTPDAGTPFIPKKQDELITPDLLVIRFTADCLIENNAEVLVPKGQKTISEAPKEAIGPVDDLEINLTETVSPTETAEVVPEVGEETEGTEEAVPNDW